MWHRALPSIPQPPTAVRPPTTTPHHSTRSLTVNPPPPRCAGDGCVSHRRVDARAGRRAPAALARGVSGCRGVDDPPVQHLGWPVCTVPAALELLGPRPPGSPSPCCACAPPHLQPLCHHPHAHGAWRASQGHGGGESGAPGRLPRAPWAASQAQCSFPGSTVHAGSTARWDWRRCSLLGMNCFGAVGHSIAVQQRAVMTPPLAASSPPLFARTVQVGWMSYVFNVGHSIRLAVSSSNYPRFSVNP